MVRIKRGNVARKRRKKVLALAKGFRGAHSRLFRVANQQVRIQFPDYSTWTNGFSYIHTTYSNGNASGLLGYLFTHNANGGSNYNKSLTQI